MFGSINRKIISVLSKEGFGRPKPPLGSGLRYYYHPNKTNRQIQYELFDASNIAYGGVLYLHEAKITVSIVHAKTRFSYLTCRNYSKTGTLWCTDTDGLLHLQLPTTPSHRALGPKIQATVLPFTRIPKPRFSPPVSGTLEVIPFRYKPPVWLALSRGGGEVSHGFSLPPAAVNSQYKQHHAQIYKNPLEIHYYCAPLESPLSGLMAHLPA